MSQSTTTKGSIYNASQSTSLLARIAGNCQGPQKVIAKLLWLELVITIGLDTANELLSSSGISVPMGQLVRGSFLLVNFLVVLEFGKRRDAQIAVLTIVFFALMVFREVSLGIGAMANAVIYWTKFLSFFLTFLAIKCVGESGKIEKVLFEKFFIWSIRVIPLSYILLALTGVLGQSTFDSGYEGYYLSKNSMSAVLLLFFSLSLYYVFQRKMTFLWSVVVAIALFLLGSKSTMVFCIVILIACVLHELRGLHMRSICMVGILFAGLLVGAWVFRDEINSTIETQLQIYQYVTTSQGGSIIDYLLTGRNDLLQAGFSSYLNDFSPLFLVVGGGISSLGSSMADILNSSGSYRGIEMDLFEIALASGLIGLLIMMTPFLVAIKGLARERPNGCYYLALGILVQFLFMVFGGHVVTEGMPAEYLGILLAYACIISKPQSRVTKVQPLATCMNEPQEHAGISGGIYRFKSVAYRRLIEPKEI